MREDHLKKCRCCGEIKYRRYGGPRRNRGGNFWFSENSNAMWNGTMCPACCTTKSNRHTGSLSLSDSPNCSVAIGIRHELFAKNYFEGLGSTVFHTGKQGPDLVINFGLGNLKVEVKKVIFTKKGAFVNRVSNRRIGDDLICYVFNEQQIFVTSMAKHLAHTRKHGLRTIYSDEFSLSGINYKYMRAHDRNNAV